MAQQIIYVGATPNDGAGDPIRTAFIKSNNNFSQLYSRAQVSPPTSLIGQIGDEAGMYAYDSTYFYYCFAEYDGSSIIWAQVTQVGNISTNQINSGNSNVIISGSGGNVVMGINGVTNAAVFTATTANLVGNVVAGGYFIGDGSLLTGLPASYANANVTAYAESGWGGNIVPSANATYNLGSATNQWKSLYVSNTTIYLGNVPIGIGAGNVLTVNGNAVLTDGSNANISTTGNIQVGAILTDGYYFANGSPFTTPTSYGNANVVANLAALASNPISTSGTITAGNINITGGSLEWSNASIVQTSASDVSITGDGQVTVRSLDGTYQWTFDSNGNLTAPGNISTTANVTANNINMSGTLTVNQITSDDSSFVTIEDGLDVNGDVTANYFIGDGSQLTNLPGGGGNTGNVTFNDINIIGTGNLKLQPDSANPSAYLDIFLTVGPDIHIAGNGATVILGTDEQANVAVNVDGNVSIQAGDVGGTQTWNFGTDGILTLPGNTIAINYLNGNLAFGNVTFSGEAVIGTGTSNTVSGLYLAPDPGSLANDLYLRVRGNILDEPTHIHFDTGNNQYYNQFIGDDLKYIQLANTGNIVINTNNYAGNTAQWNFDYNGVLTLPNGATIQDTAGNAVVFGINAGNSAQGNGAVAIGQQAGETSQGTSAVAVGGYAGATNQGSDSVAVGLGAGNDTQGITAVAVGREAGYVTQGNAAVAIGEAAGYTNQGTEAVAIGLSAGFASQGNYAVAIGKFSANSSQGEYSVAVGPLTGQTTQGAFAVAMGYSAGYTTQANSAIAIGQQAGETSQGQYAVAVGPLTGQTTQGAFAVAMGYSAGYTTQANSAIAIGGFAGFNLQGDNAVAIGGLAGNSSQGTQAVAVGLFAGQEDQGQFSVAIGGGAGQQTQGEESVAIGSGAGSTVQGNAAVAIGSGAGAANQRINSVAIGASAGAGTQGQYAVAIGASAGYTNQGNNSIILNATGANLDQTTANTFTVAPVRNDVANIGSVMFYNTTSKEITYGNTISVAGNITCGTLVGNVTGAGAGVPTISSTSNLVLSAVGNVVVTGGYLNMSGNVSASGNISGGNLSIGTISVTGNVTSGNIITAGNITGNTAGFAIGYRDIPQVSFTANTTIATTDAGKHYYSTLSTGNVLTIANNASQGFQVGGAISIVNQGTGNITVAQDSGVTIYLAGNATSGNRTVATFGMATLIKVATDTWFINGTGVT